MSPETTRDREQKPGRAQARFGLAVALVLSPLALHALRAAEQILERATLSVDFGPHGQRVAPRWVEWSEDRDQEFSTAFDANFEIELDEDHSWRDRGQDLEREQDRDDNEDRPVAVEVQTDPMTFVLRDGLRERDDRDVRLTFKRLDPGDYVLELFSCDMGEETRSAVGRFDIEIDGKVVLEDQSTMGRVSLAGAALPPLILTSRGETIVVKLVRREGDLWLNGFILSGPARAEPD